MLLQQFLSNQNCAELSEPDHCWENSTQYLIKAVKVIQVFFPGRLIQVFLLSRKTVLLVLLQVPQALALLSKLSLQEITMSRSWVEWRERLWPSTQFCHLYFLRVQWVNFQTPYLRCTWNLNFVFIFCQLPLHCLLYVFDGAGHP